ncbi:MAB_1171c family putative transporter [Actinoplanes sp. NPDC049599]|uniref:MAB_1171c family putative transporter n=1 Tax=Actinoplanes sp. NPDC049599 TaxID=3363903 RepID=UPI0037A74AE3
MNGALTGTVLVLLWGMVLVRLPTLFRDAQQRAIWATLCTLALAKTVATPGVNKPVAELIPEAQVLPHLLGVVTAYFLLRFITLITHYDRAHPQASRFQLLLAASVLVALITLLLATPGGIKTGGSELMSTTATAPTAAAYWVVLNGYLGTVLAIATALFWRIGRSAPARLLRNSLRAIAAGTFLVTLYAVVKTGAIVAHSSFGVTFPVDSIEPAANALRTIGTIVALIGALVPASGKVRTAVRAYRALWALRPLWRVMRKTFPEVILFPRRRALLELAGVDEVQLRLYRRVIEIRDGMLTLRDYLPAGALAEARGYVGDNPALVEACGITLALARHRSGAAATEHGDRWATIGGNVQDEVAWLSAVSAAFRRQEPATFAARQPEGAPP